MDNFCKSRKNYLSRQNGTKIVISQERLETMRDVIWESVWKSQGGNMKILSRDQSKR